MAEPIEIIIRQGGQNGLGIGGSSGGGFGATRGASAIRGQATGLLSGSEQPGSGLLKQLTVGDALVLGYMKSNAMQAIHYGISQYGNQTGDYISQRAVRNALSVASSITGIMMSTFAGAAAGAAAGGVGAVPGALIGFTVALTSEVVKIGSQTISFNTDVRKQNIQAEFMRERAGSTLGSGSRGTYE